jgi:tRNA(fMet)-specific endonuclease VapC
MSRYLLDTNALADFVFRRHGMQERVESARLAGHAIGTSLPALAELFAGVENSASREFNLPTLNRQIRLVRLWPFTLECSREYGRLYAQLRRAGRTVQMADLMSAAIAIILGDCTVVTTDSDFSSIPGLRVEDWTKQN